MARTTRSTAALQDTEKDTLPPPQQKPAKKRKRASAADTTEEQPLQKLKRTESPEVPQNTPSVPSFSAAEAPINDLCAKHILEVLEEIDKQGLLDRVFPTSLETHDLHSLSLKSLLTDHSNYPLSTLRTAVENLFPISSHPRSRRSGPAQQQLQFCNVAMSLLDQASFYSAESPPDIDSIFASKSEAQPSSASSKSSQFQRRYALLQSLPSGDWWTSINSGAGANAQNLKDLPTGHAELTAVLPQSSSSSSSPPTLGRYQPQTTVFPRAARIAGRKLTAGSFLDYGPYASFAPTFAHDGKEIGKTQVGEVLWWKQKRARERARHALLEMEGAAEIREETMEANDTTPESIVEEKQADSIDPALRELGESFEGLLSDGESEAIKSVLADVELEKALSELLERNKKALKRLEELQRIRLSSADGASATVKEGSEEWDIAQGISENLAILASLRPRETSSSSLVPAPSELHRLHRVLSLHTTSSQPPPGWYGTLPATNFAAIRDDSTLKVKPRPAVTATAIATPTTPTPTTPYAGYPSPYTTYQPYRYGQYGNTPKPTANTTTSFYGSTYGSPVTGNTTQSYYGAGNTTYAGQQQYGYHSAWYQNYNGASTTGATTAQPYAGQVQTRVAPVANTIKSYTPSGGVAYGQTQSVPTLPAHLNRTGSTPTYYGAYQ